MSEKPSKSSLSVLVDKHIAGLSATGIARNIAVAEAGSSTATPDRSGGNKRSSLAAEVDRRIATPSRN